MSRYQRITMNLVGARKRYEELDGKRYLVVPAVMLTVGVHNGSQGPLFYPSEELSKNPVSWNLKPVVIDHPSLNGDGVSACSPDILKNQGVGQLFESSWDGRLKTEAWLDEDKLKRVNQGVLDRINNNEMIEVSTGLYHDPEEKTGTWNGKKYVGVVRNIQPDHLAILPDTEGACSIADGAGLLRNADGSELSFDDVRSQLHAILRPQTNIDKGPLTECGGGGYVYVCDVYPKYAVYEQNNKSYKVNYRVKGGKVSIIGEPEEVRKVTSYVTENGAVIVKNEEHQGPLKSPKHYAGLNQPHEGELSEVNRKNLGYGKVQEALKEHYSGTQQEGDWGGWVTDLYANYVVFSKDNKLFRLPYTYDDDKIRFDGEPEEVERVSEYRTRRNTPIDGTSSPFNVNMQGSQAMANNKQQTRNVMHAGAHHLLHEPTHHDAHHDPAHEEHGGKSDSQTRTSAGGARHDAVNKLISDHGWGEEDRKFLMDLPDDHFERVNSHSTKGAHQPIVPYSYDGIGDRSSVHGTGTHMGAAHNKAQNADEYISNAPPEIREVLVNAMATAKAEKLALIKVIVANQNNRFSDKWLATLPIDQLRGMAALAGGLNRGVQNYSGQGEVPMFLENRTSDEETNDDGPILGLPGVFMDVDSKNAS